MELFYSQDIDAGRVILGEEEAAHCVRVLRHREGDGIEVIDGRGTLYRCVLTHVGTGTGKSRPSAEARIVSCEKDWGAHPYLLTLAVCPTKNPDRYEWMAEKAAEAGLDVLVPVIGERSERRVQKTDRLQRVLLSAAKQSLKAAVTQVAEPVSVMDFIKESRDGLKLIAYCSDEVQARDSITEALSRFFAGNGDTAPGKPRITVLVGPEGDFSPEEVRAAIGAGYVPVHLGPSRLRTETAGLLAATATYLAAMDATPGKAYQSE